MARQTTPDRNAEEVAGSEAAESGGGRPCVEIGRPPIERNRGLETLLEIYRFVRNGSVSMVAPLQPEDFRAQPWPEVSPPWWNLGHTSWFFARNVLLPLGGEYSQTDRRLDFVLNSYYAGLGPRIERRRRGSLTRPTTREVFDYRQSVDARMERLMRKVPPERIDELVFLVRIGIEHERQHQELFYTEIKAILWENPSLLRDSYAPPLRPEPPPGAATEPRFLDFGGGLFEFGNCEGGWCWDNELPVHQHRLEDFCLQDQPVSNGAYLEFVADGGYDEQLLWLDNGWERVRQQGWKAPLYWERIDGEWMIWTLHGMRHLDPREPVCHVSFYEAEAFARWKSRSDAACRGARLPSEREWEHAARTAGGPPSTANLLEGGRLHPTAAAPSRSMRQMLGDVWEWTSSYYEPYPGYRPFPGAFAEYNGKFMDNQRVLRGGSCVTPRDHIRISYRNFWGAATRFQFSGFRLASDR